MPDISSCSWEQGERAWQISPDSSSHLAKQDGFQHGLKNMDRVWIIISERNLRHWQRSCRCSSMFDRIVTTKGPCWLSASNHLFPSLVTAATVLRLHYSIHWRWQRDRKSSPLSPSSGNFNVKPVLPADIPSQEHLLAGSGEGLAENNSLSQK